MKTNPRHAALMAAQARTHGDYLGAVVPQMNPRLRGIMRILAK